RKRGPGTAPRPRSRRAHRRVQRGTAGLRRAGRPVTVRTRLTRPASRARRPALLSWFKHTARGVAMGVADVIPGVSGGTLALILGIYEKFIGAVSAVGPGMLKAVLTREFWRRFIAGLKTPGAQGEDA